MLSLIATLRVKEGKAEDAREFLGKLAAEVRDGEPGTLAYVCHQRRDDPRTFVVYEKYDSQESFKAHGANLAKHGARFADLLDARPELQMLEEL
jgi:quinol monooxygenase YgiN